MGAAAWVPSAGPPTHSTQTSVILEVGGPVWAMDITSATHVDDTVVG